MGADESALNPEALPAGLAAVVRSATALQFFATPVPKKGMHIFAVHFLTVPSIHNPAIDFGYLLL